MDSVLIDVDIPSELNHEVLYLLESPPKELIDFKVLGVIHAIRNEIGRIRHFTYQKIKAIHDKYNIELNLDEFYELEKNILEKNKSDTSSKKLASFLNTQQRTLFSATDKTCIVNLCTVICLYESSLRNAHMQIWETCFRDLCAANLKLGAVSSIDSKLSKTLKSTDLANQRHRNENKKTQIIIERVVALWEAGNTAAGIRPVNERSVKDMTDTELEAELIAYGFPFEDMKRRVVATIRPIKKTLNDFYDDINKDDE